MDCETFENQVMDVLYEEATPETLSEARRHVDGCTRCSALFTSLRGARSEVRLVLEEPSPALEERILAATRLVQTTLPFHRRVLRWLSWAGSHAMRPQFAMAAVLMLILGSSLLLVRARPGAPGAGPVAVTERGVPSVEEGEGATPPPAAMATAAAELAAQAAPMDAEKAEPAETALAEAQATEERSGCAAAAPRYDEVARRHPGSGVGTAARWEAARCYEKAGNVERARELYAALGSDPVYGSRAAGALASLPESKASGAPGGGAGAAAALPAAAARAAPAKAAAKPKMAAESNDAFEESERAPAAAATPKAAAPAANDVGF